jgi:hypothetical protein
MCEIVADIVILLGGTGFTTLINTRRSVQLASKRELLCFLDSLCQKLFAADDIVLRGLNTQRRRKEEEEEKENGE